MTVPYSINGGSEIHSVNSSWEHLRARDEVDNQATFIGIAINTWRLSHMSVTDFETFRALQGSELESLETNNIENRAVAAQYTTVIVGLVQGRHDGVYMRDVSIRFTVDLDSEV